MINDSAVESDRCSILGLLLAAAMWDGSKDGAKERVQDSAQGVLFFLLRCFGNARFRQHIFDESHIPLLY